MKKLYIAPTIETIRIASQCMLALSVESDEKVDKDNQDDFEQLSNSFQGGITFWEE